MAGKSDEAFAQIKLTQVVLRDCIEQARDLTEKSDRLLDQHRREPKRELSRETPPADFSNETPPATLNENIGGD